MQEGNRPYSYTDAGFNRFFSRNIASSPDVRNLSQVSTTRTSSRSLNFDQLQVSGSLGDTLRIGRIYLNGREGRISIQDVSDRETVRIGAF